MAKSSWTQYITDSATGATVEGASVTVFLSDGVTPATIFSDPAGSAKANPFLTPAGGKAEFYASPGIYVIQASKDGQIATWNNEEIGHARRDLDLSDLDSAATARTNLGLKSAAVADIIGTVSQSGGVPTGSVIERGTNANGEFVKFADGTMIMHSAVALNYTALTDYPYTLPATLAATANVVPTVSVDNNASFDYQIGITLNSTTQVTFRSNANAGGLNTIRFSVTGRWF